MATHEMVTARTAHTCKNCGKKIEVGTVYLFVNNPFKFRKGKTRDVIGDPTCGAYCDETCFEIKQVRQRWW